MPDAAMQRILAIDAGNSRVKWGLHDGDEWFLLGSFATAAAGTGEAFSHLPPDTQLDRIIVSNVAGPQVANHIKDALYGFGRPLAFIESQSGQCGVSSRYQPPASLGSDRWAALIAAHTASKTGPASAQSPLLVVMAGTALTVDALNGQGIFLGGIIVPGIVLMRASLNRGTAQLPALGPEDGDYQTFPCNTANAISVGAIEACSGAVQRMYTHLSAQTGAVPHCIASGGAIDAISGHLPFPVSINHNLVLDGLLAIALASTTPPPS